LELSVLQEEIGLESGKFILFLRITYLIHYFPTKLYILRLADWARCCMPETPGTQEVEVGGWRV
jgi:hypothetical protein